MSENRLFLDACGWLALLNASDQLHREAADVWRQCGRLRYTIFVTDWVIAETGNGLARSRLKGAFALAYRRLQASARARLVQISLEDIDQAITLYHERADKDWGLVDCMSFLVMEREGILEAFTNDRHFEQSGFRCVLSQPAG